jgi:drug/metabolite transporter (DMT)-like permease
MPPLALALIVVSTFMHAGWNLLARGQRSSPVLLHMLVLTGLVGVGPTLAGEQFASPVFAAAGGHLVLAGFFQGLYFFGLTLGYRLGEFTVVYPLARALPVLLIALADLALGRPPSALGWAGILLVFGGCLLAPLSSLRSLRLDTYVNRGTFWALVTAAGVMGYTLTDAAAASLLAPGPSSALRYGLFETVLTVPFYWLMLRMAGARADTSRPGSWARLVLISILVFGAYGLVLWSYQLSAQTSYIIALRQFSIVVGVALGSVLFGEPAAGLRVSAALIITLGTVCIALAP